MTYYELFGTAALLGLRIRYWIVILVVIVIILGLVYWARARAV